MRTAVVYTFPFETTMALQAVAEIENMGNLDTLEATVRGVGVAGVPDAPTPGEEEDARTAARLLTLERIEELRLRRDELVATLPPVRQVRLLVRAASYNDQAHYKAVYKEGMDWFEAQTGRAVDADLGGDPELVSLRNFVVFRAEMLCAIDRRRENGQTRYMGEERRFAYDKESTTLVGWQPWSLPGGWVSLEGMGENLPMELFGEWLTATRELNVGVLTTIPFFFRPKRATRSLIA